MNKNLSAYVVITHIFQPEQRNGPNRGKVNVKEQIEFVDRLKNRHLDSSTAIVDILNEKMVKNRATEATFANYVEYLDEKYPDQMGQLYSLLGIQKVINEEVDNNGTSETASGDTSRVADEPGSGASAPTTATGESTPSKGRTKKMPKPAKPDPIDPIADPGLPFEPVGPIEDPTPLPTNPVEPPAGE